MITHFTRFENEPAAKAALLAYWSVTGAKWDWNRSIVDGPIPIVTGTGTFTTTIDGTNIEIMQAVPGYFLNIALPALDVTLPGLTAAGYGPADNFTRVYGTAPVTPQRVFE